MKREKLESMLADLGYALLYLKEAQSKGVAYADLNRTRELISKVGDSLKVELAKTKKVST